MFVMVFISYEEVNLVYDEENIVNFRVYLGTKKIINNFIN